MFRYSFFVNKKVLTFVLFLHKKTCVVVSIQITLLTQHSFLHFVLIYRKKENICGEKQIPRYPFYLEIWSRNTTKKRCTVQPVLKATCIKQSPLFRGHIFRTCRSQIGGYTCIKQVPDLSILILAFPQVQVVFLFYLAGEKVASVVQIKWKMKNTVSELETERHTWTWKSQTRLRICVFRSS